MSDKYPNALAVVRWANLYGVESAGVWQMRGNGVFVLYEDEIYFLRWLIKKEIRIPIKNITGMETPKSFLGKTNFTPLLKIAFIDANGNADAAAWLLPDVNGMKSQIEALLK